MYASTGDEVATGPAGTAGEGRQRQWEQFADMLKAVR